MFIQLPNAIKIMNPVILYVIGFAFMTQSASLLNTINEVCDTEGSGIDDCPTGTHCCTQSKCDIIFNAVDAILAVNANKITDTYIDVEYEEAVQMCCKNLTKTNNQNSNNCKICTKCCEENERLLIPLPHYCSKCRKCTAREDTGSRTPCEFESDTGS